MKKILGLLLVLFATSFAFSKEDASTAYDGSKNFAVSIKFNYVNSIHNSFVDGSGNYYVATIEDPVNFLGLGVTYRMPISERWNFTPGYYLQGGAQKLFNFSNGMLAQITAYFDYKIDNYGFYLGPNVQQIVGSKPLNYSPSMGGGGGFRYYINSDFSVDAGFDFITLKSENSAGGINDQKTEYRSWMLALSYLLF